jgi:hypothetical protein
MNRYRMRQLRNRPDRGGPIADQDPDDGGSVNSELYGAADDVYAEASKHRAGVIQKDLAAKARKKKGARRG